jgi:hypothetical protein
MRILAPVRGGHRSGAEATLLTGDAELPDRKLGRPTKDLRPMRAETAGGGVRHARAKRFTASTQPR